MSRRPANIALVILLAHIFGSFGLELGKIVINEGTSFPDVLRSPVRDLPHEAAMVWRYGLRNVPSYTDLLFWWSFYLVPFAITVIVVPYFVKRRQRRRGHVAGFDLLPSRRDEANRRKERQ